MFLTILAVAALAVVGVSVTGIVINIRESALANSKLKALTQRIIDVQEEERSRVARELHDGISQLLVSTKYSLEAAAMGKKGTNQQDQKALKATTERLTSAIHEVRRISRDLRPYILDDLGLSTALKNLVEDFATRNGMEADVSTIAFKNVLPKDVKIGLYRIAQEALTNIERHANATKVSLRLAIEATEVVMEITDNGCGFDRNKIRNSKTVARGMGLRNMRERVLYFKGTVEIRTSKNGSRITARLPKSIIKSSLVAI